MATKLTGDALADKVKSKLDGQEVRVQGKTGFLSGALKKLAVTAAIITVMGVTAAPAQAGFFDDLKKGAKEVATQTVNGAINNVERGIERGVAREVQKKSNETIGATERKVRKDTGGIVNSNAGSKTVQQTVNKARQMFNLPKIGK